MSEEDLKNAALRLRTAYVRQHTEYLQAQERLTTLMGLLDEHEQTDSYVDFVNNAVARNHRALQAKQALDEVEKRLLDAYDAQWGITKEDLKKRM